MKWFFQKAKAATAVRAKPTSDQQGRWGERKAAEWLCKNAKLKLLGIRVKAGRGEIDLVMEDPASEQRSLVFVEVKTRSSRAFGGGMAAINHRKRHALCEAVASFLRRHPPCTFRIDAVEIYGNAAENRVDEVEHFINAIPMEVRILPGGLPQRRR